MQPKRAFALRYCAVRTAGQGSSAAQRKRFKIRKHAPRMGTGGEKSSNHLLAGLALRVGLCSFKKQEHVAANRQRSASHTTKRLDCARARVWVYVFISCTVRVRFVDRLQKKRVQHSIIIMANDESQPQTSWNGARSIVE